MIFIEFPDLESESNVAGYEGQVSASSLHFAVSRNISEITSSRTVRTVSNPMFSEVVFTCIYDSAAPYLMALATNGDAMAEVVITFLKDTGPNEKVDYLVITLTNVYISSCTNSSGGEEPTLTINMTFDKIESLYKALDEDHTVAGEHPYSYDLSTSES